MKKFKELESDKYLNINFNNYSLNLNLFLQVSDMLGIMRLRLIFMNFKNKRLLN